MDDGVTIPRFKAVCTAFKGPEFLFAHQEQVHDFSAEEIDALPFGRKTVSTA